MELQERCWDLCWDFHCRWWSPIYPPRPTAGETDTPVHYHLDGIWPKAIVMIVFPPEPRKHWVGQSSNPACNVLCLLSLPPKAGPLPSVTLFLKCRGSPHSWGSVGWALFCKARGHWFDSWSGHMPGLWVWSLVGVHTRGNWMMFLCTLMFVSLSLPPSFSL